MAAKQDSPRSASWTRARGILVAAVVFACACGPAQAQQEARIAAVVDDEVISLMDLMSRTRLVLFGAGLAPTEENINRLMPQILNTLIDETVQWQAAQEQNVSVRDQEIEEALGGIEQRNNLPPGGLDAFLAERNLDKSTLVNQVRASLAWAKLVERRLRPQVEIGSEEVEEVLRRAAENQGKPQLLVSEIFLANQESAGDGRVRDSAIRITQQIRAGASFEALARAFSQNATAAAGGDLGWLTEDQLDDEIARAVSTMQPGQVAGPIRSAIGYHVILLRDRRLAGGADPSQITVDLRQIGLPLPPEPTQADLSAVQMATSSLRSGATDCAALEEVARDVNAKVAKVGRIRIADLAEPLQATLMGLGINQISAPLRTRQGVVMFMVCDREAPPAELPSREQITARLQIERLDLLARRYLRDLRHAAFVDVRI
ncbi:MAG: peptidylprolyl isomerase [Rhodospirillales bacterium]|nr:MAG: peptidylprolyl isomerase [Rhodospirillales bacterium]